MRIKFIHDEHGWQVYDLDRASAYKLTTSCDRWASGFRTVTFPSKETAYEGLKRYFEKHPEEFAEYIATRLKDSV